MSKGMFTEVGLDYRGYTKNLPVYRRWMAMWNRVLNPLHPRNHHYGEVTICDRWKSFADFQADVGSPPTSKHHLKMLDKNLGYRPDNVVWMSGTEARRLNPRRNIIMVGGKPHFIEEYARREKVPRDRLVSFMRTHGLPPERAVREIRRSQTSANHLQRFDGVLLTKAQIAKSLRVSMSRVRQIVSETGLVWLEAARYAAANRKRVGRPSGRRVCV